MRAVEPVVVKVLGLVDEDRVELGAELVDRLDESVGEFLVPVALRRLALRIPRELDVGLLRETAAEGVEVPELDAGLALGRSRRCSRSARLKQTNSTSLPFAAEPLGLLDAQASSCLSLRSR